LKLIQKEQIHITLDTETGHIVKVL